MYRLGGWCFGDEIITPTELLSLWDSFKLPANKKLTIISDSCFSGFWTNAFDHHKEVVVIAACKENQRAEDTEIGGLFTAEFVKANPNILKGSNSMRELCVSQSCALPLRLHRP